MNSSERTVGKRQGGNPGRERKWKKKGGGGCVFCPDAVNPAKTPTCCNRKGGAKGRGNCKRGKGGRNGFADSFSVQDNKKK